jgi:phosphoribosylaminoimidazole (AIR) synthetase
MSSDELHRTLNMGIGMVLVCADADVDAVQGAIPEPTWRIGTLIPGTRRVHLTEHPPPPSWNPEPGN